MNATQDLDHDHGPPVTPTSIIFYALDYARRRQIISEAEAQQAREAHRALLELAELVVKHNAGPTNASPVPTAKAVLALFLS